MAEVNGHRCGPLSDAKLGYQRPALPRLRVFSYWDRQARHFLHGYSDRLSELKGVQEDSHLLAL